MAIDKSRFSLLAFPQSVDATGMLSLNLVFLPRNISPLDDVRDEGVSLGPPFVNVNPDFTIKVVNNANEFPGKLPAPPDEESRPAIGLQYSNKKEAIYLTLRDAKQADGVTSKYFDIDEQRSADRASAKFYSAEDPQPRDKALRKYLPFSYRQAFNFTAPRLPNAVTDDSYHCAVRDTAEQPFQKSDDRVSWGKVYAHLMRQPQIAEAAGLIYRTHIQLNPGDLELGGWIYADVLSGEYSAQQAASEALNQYPFIRKYAARIPPISAGVARNLFTAVLFPVVKAGQNPAGIYDDLFIEAARYSEGFAGLVHSYQPHSQNLLVEKADGFHPQKEMGVRLGWDDEQLLIWYLRQLAVDANVPGNGRLDAPLGVSGFAIDVREFGAQNWESLTAVTSNGDLTLEDISLGNFNGELPFQVYPTKLAGNFWLPMYFANWNDHSMVLPDKRAAELYANDRDKNMPVTVTDAYSAPNYVTRLKYGEQFEFRVRLRDISGGGPSVTTEQSQDRPGDITKTHFKRYLAPNALLLRHDINELKPNTDDENFSVATIRLQRPLLGYPAVLFTAKYSEADALNRLRQNRDDNFAKQAASLAIDGFGIPDLDVTGVEIKVEVETLRMDNLLSDDGRQNFITLFRTLRNFDPGDADHLLEIPITWRDQFILNLGDTTEPFDNVNDNDTIAQTVGEIILPKARNVRITLRAYCNGNEDYWGNYSETDDALDARRGKPITLSLRQESATEPDMLGGSTDPQFIQGIYLQPDPKTVKLNPLLFKTLNGNNSEDQIPNVVQRLGKQLDVAVKDLTLTAENGQRLVFWCSNLLRHTMAPDNSSITLSGSDEICGHWLVCTTVSLNRDWTWDSLNSLSILVERRRKVGRDPQAITNKAWQPLGSLDIQRIASYQAIQVADDGKIHRNYTRIIFIDVIDANPALGQLPDTSEVQYRLSPQLRAGIEPVAAIETTALLLPATVNPSQTPKLTGAGIALSPYVRNHKYSATEARTRYLWLEFDRKPDDDNDELFARVLALAPDQLISNNDPSLLDIPEESNLPIDPEYIRVVTPQSGHVHAGLNAMQKMEKSTENDRHFYLLPLPPGLHHESHELFGFFTYEFRFGHSDRLWSTAQGRFGRPLRVAGLQHPAPNLICMVNRDDKHLRVTAPFARAVVNGRNVTSDPPRTSIWCLLYAQVKQADGLDYRNILLDEVQLERRHPSRDKFSQNVAAGLKEELIIKQFQQAVALEKEAIKYAYGGWKNSDVGDMLSLYGLPPDSPLSVVCVEVFGQITNIYRHINDVQSKRDELVTSLARNYGQDFAGAVEKETSKTLGDQYSPDETRTDPLKSQLGWFRILRTSPLTEVPFVCCTE